MIVRRTCGSPPLRASAIAVFGHACVIERPQGLQGGVGAKAAVSGTYHVNPDCTGTSTLVLPPPFPTIVSDFVIVDHGKRIKEIVTSPAAHIVTAVYTRK